MTLAATEIERQRLQAALDGSKSLADRRAFGQFATPPELARDIARATAAYFPASGVEEMLEPSAGTGAFISAFLGEPAVCPAHATAIELDSGFFEAGRTLWTGWPVEYRHADFTRLAPDRHFNLVVANPPYVRHHGIGSEEKKRLQAAVRSGTGLAISGLAGLYCHFLLLSAKWMKPGAVGVWLIPSEWMAVNYGASLRSFFSERVCLLRVHRFDADDVRFPDALVSSCVVWFRNAPPGGTALFTQGRDLAAPARSVAIPVASLRTAVKWPPSAGEQESAAPVPRLRDFFAIRRGIATGDNTFFILPEEEAFRRNLPLRFLKPILPSPRYLKTDWILSASDGAPANAERLYLFDCTGYAPGQLPDAARAYLAEGEETTAKKKLCAARTRWYDQEQRSPAPILCSYMGRGDGNGAPVRFILNESDAIASNSFLLLYPKEPLKRIFRDDPASIVQVWKLLRAIPGGEFRRAGRCYGGGLRKMEPRELGDLDCTALQDWLDAQDISFRRAEASGQLLLVMESPPSRYGRGRQAGKTHPAVRKGRKAGKKAPVEPK